MPISANQRQSVPIRGNPCQSVPTRGTHRRRRSGGARGVLGGRLLLGRLLLARIVHVRGRDSARGGARGGACLLEGRGAHLRVEREAERGTARCVNEWAEENQRRCV